MNNISTARNRASRLLIWNIDVRESSVNWYRTSTYHGHTLKWVKIRLEHRHYTLDVTSFGLCNRSSFVSENCRIDTFVGRFISEVWYSLDPIVVHRLVGIELSMLMRFQ